MRWPISDNADFGQLANSLKNDDQSRNHRFSNDGELWRFRRKEPLLLCSSYTDRSPIDTNFGHCDSEHVLIVTSEKDDYIEK